MILSTWRQFTGSQHRYMQRCYGVFKTNCALMTLTWCNFAANNALVVVYKLVFGPGITPVRHRRTNTTVNAAIIASIALGLRKWHTATQIATALRSTSIRHRSDTFVSDRYVIVDPRAFRYLGTGISHGSLSSRQNKSVGDNQDMYTLFTFCCVLM